MPSFLRPLKISLLVFVFALTACKTPPPRPLETTAPPVQITSPVVTPQPKPPRVLKIGLALGGGAARGFAHIGVIKILEAQGIMPDLVVGTSAGSLVGALYAAGNNGMALHRLALDMDEATISDWSVPLFSSLTGVLKGEALQRYVNMTVHDVPLEKLKIPFGAVATDLNSGAAVLFRRGNTGLAVRASSAVPGIFQPVNIGNRTYVDGGLVSPVPARFAREMGADFVIAVNISMQPEGQPTSSTIDMLLQTVTIMGKTISRQELRDADIVIQPKLAGMKGDDFNSRNRAILAGEQAAINALPEIKRKLKEMRAQP